MKQVDFYLIENAVSQASFKLASRLANKLQRMQQSALLVTNSADDTQTLDSIMWSFSDASFLAHDMIDSNTMHANIQIGAQNAVSNEVLERNYDVLINLADDVAIYSHHFSRIAEIVAPDDDSKAKARSRFKHYQTEGFELKTHNIQL